MDDTQKPKTSPKDFFLHLGVIVLLYATVGFLLNLLFTVINTAYPEVNSYYSYYNNRISFPVAALIVLFPLFVLLSWLTYRSYEIDPLKKQLGVRKWLTYLTLFVTGAVIAGDLITVIYYFLDGRDFTVSFILKAISVIVVATMIFVYYIYDLRDKVSSSQRKIWVVVSAVVVVVAIVLGFTVIGSPKTQRNIKYDNQKISDLQNIQGRIVNYWQAKGELPKDLDSLKDSLSYGGLPKDPQSGNAYEYNALPPLSFELCAVFNLDSKRNSAGGKYYETTSYPARLENENWEHVAGRVCFERNIDPALYPVRNRTIIEDTNPQKVINPL